MNTPTHLAAGGLVSQVVFCLDARFGRQMSRAVRLSLCSAGCVVLGVASHLALDELPHYNWIVYMHWLSGLSHSWLIRDAILGLIIFVPVLYLGRDRWALTCLTAVAAMYPDLEKVAYQDFGLPERYVLFRAHSLQLSHHDYGLPHPLLIAFELAVMSACLLACWKLAQARSCHSSVPAA